MLHAPPRAKVLSPGSENRSRNQSCGAQRGGGLNTHPSPSRPCSGNVLRAAGDGPFPPLGFSFSFFALFRYVKISGGTLGQRGAGAAHSRGSWCGAVLLSMGPACLPPSLSLWPEVLRCIPTAGVAPHQPRAVERPWPHTWSFARWATAGPWRGGRAELPRRGCAEAAALAAGTWPLRAPPCQLLHE